MSEHGYSILAEFWGEVPPDRLDHATDGIIEAVRHEGGDGTVVSADESGIDVRFSLLYDVPRALAEIGVEGERIARASVEATGLSLDLEALHVQTDAALEREVNTPAPGLIGLSEIAGILGVSKQRVGQLRAREDFPAPVAELAAGPVWQRQMLDRFIRDWPRRSGRPAKASA
jgi:hypothetical protein